MFDHSLVGRILVLAQSSGGATTRAKVMAHFLSGQTTLENVDAALAELDANALCLRDPLDVTAGELQQFPGFDASMRASFVEREVLHS